MASSCDDDPPPGYVVPEWSGTPMHNYGLEVIKEGSVLECISLGEKALYVVGRRPECDISSAHASLSRVHAVLQHSSDGSLHIFDMSTHGTFCNKQRVPQRAFFQVFVGDVIKFGESSRLYVVQGPEGLRRVVRDARKEAAMALKTKLRVEAARRAEVERLQRRESEGASWGDVSMEDALQNDETTCSEDRGDDEPLIIDPRRSLNPRQAKLSERLEKQREKLQNLEKQLTALSNKELERELSEGQRTAFDRARTRHQEVTATIQQIEATLRNSFRSRRDQEQGIHGREGGTDDRKKKKKIYDSDGDDEFYDRTQQAQAKREKKKKKQQEEDATNDAKEKKKKKNLEEEEKPLGQGIEARYDLPALQELLEEKNRQLRMATKDWERSSQPPPATASDDSLDAYVAKMQESIRADKCKQAKKAMAAIEKERAGLIKGLSRRERWQKLQELEQESKQQRRNAAGGKAAATTGMAAALERVGELEKKRAADSESQQRRDTIREMDAERRQQHQFMERLHHGEQQVLDGKQLVEAIQSTGKALPDALTPDTLSAIISSAQSSNTLTIAEKFHKEQAAKKRRQAVLDSVKGKGGGLITSSLSSSIESSKRCKRMPPPTFARTEKPPQEQQQLPMAADFAEWTPPVNQRGDGKTSLNDRFGY